MRKVILSSDSTCDIGPELQKKYDIQYLNYHIQLEGKSYIDTVEISPDDLYSAWRERKVLPQTAAISPAEYIDYFKKWVDDGFDVVHLSLGSGITSSYSNCQLAAKELGHVYPVDTENLSTGMGHLVVKAGELAQQGCGALEIQEQINKMKHRVHTSFLLNTLEFMKAGGRCSTVAALGANLLKLKPCIEVDSQNGSKMHAGKKYRGSMEKCLIQYVHDKLDGREDLDLDRIFITHSGSPDSDIEAVKAEVKSIADFREVFVTRANCAISTHCGPRTLGVLFMTKES